MRYALTNKRLHRATVIRTRYARGTFTGRLNRSRTWLVQARAVRNGKAGHWSRAKRLRFVKPRRSPVVTHKPYPAANSLLGFWAGPDSVGATTTARENFLRVSGYLGRPQVYRMYYSGLPQTPFSTSDADYGPPVVVSFKASPAYVMAGTYDAYLRRWFQSIPSTRQVWWSYWHEPEDEIEARRFSAWQYRAAWEHILALAPRRSTLRATLILMGYTQFKSSRVIKEYVPRGLDVLAWDSYLTKTTKTTWNVIEKPRAVSTAFGLGFAIAETAVAKGYNMPGMDHAQTVAELCRALLTQAPRIQAQFVTWFESNKLDGDWRMRPYSEAITDWLKVW
jgi:hypothetical protein